MKDFKMVVATIEDQDMLFKIIDKFDLLGTLTLFKEVLQNYFEESEDSRRFIIYIEEILKAEGIVYLTEDIQ